MKRAHQQEFEIAINNIVTGAIPAKKIIAHVTPGGGKSALPIIAGKLIGAGLVDKLLWICPRMSLQSQGERNFIDPFFRDMFGHDLTIRSSTNEPDPCRGHTGFITTYQAIAADRYSTILQALHKHRYAIVLDEFHHVEEGGEWHDALRLIMAAVEYQILMTGTLQRGDDKKIAFIEYSREAYGHRPVLHNTNDQIVISYTRKQALQDRAILPIHFVFSDGRAAYENRAGDQINVESFYNALPKERGHVLYAALSTEFAEHLLGLCLNHFIKYQQKIRSAKMLVVTANIDQARKHFKNLDTNTFAVGLATSHDSPQAVENIEKFKRGEINILVTIAMAYEGLDVPEISHIACLTHIRTKPWIEQMFARAVRINRRAGGWKDQIAYLFVPDDVLMREIVDDITIEQLRHALDSEASSRILEPGEGSQEPAITPLESAITNHRQLILDDNFVPPTPKQQEAMILREIEGIIRRYSYEMHIEPRAINTELARHFGPRRLMRYSELEKLLAHVKQKYRVNFVKKGRLRQASNVEFVDPDEFDTDFMKGFEY